MEESLAVLEELRVEGLIRHPATSNHGAWRMCEMFAIREREDWAKPWIAQPMYNLAARGIEQEYLAFTAHYGGASRIEDLEENTRRVRHPAAGRRGAGRL